jgi:hypothetical protein
MSGVLTSRLHKRNIDASNGSPRRLLGVKFKRPFPRTSTTHTGGGLTPWVINCDNVIAPVALLTTTSGD